MKIADKKLVMDDGTEYPTGEDDRRWQRNDLAKSLTRSFHPSLPRLAVNLRDRAGYRILVTEISLLPAIAIASSTRTVATISVPLSDPRPVVDDPL